MRNGFHRQTLGFTLALLSATAACESATQPASSSDPSAQQSLNNPGAADRGPGQLPTRNNTNAATPSSASEKPYGAESRYWPVNQGGTLPAKASYPDTSGAVEILNAHGPIETKSHPFFVPLGQNGRACISCHQPKDGMSLSTRTIRERWNETAGKDPVFSAIDGSNCPSLPESRRASHSLLLNRGLFRISLPWPPRAADGSSIKPEFTIELVRDPTGCNADPIYGLQSAHPMISIFRRPRPVANLKYVTTPFGSWSPKNGLVLKRDPQTGLRIADNLMADNRLSTLQAQAADAILNHEQAATAPDKNVLKQLADFEIQLFAAQAEDTLGGSLRSGGASGGPEGLEAGKPATLGSHIGDFPEFAGWKTSEALGHPTWDRNTPPGNFPASRPDEASETPQQKAFRDSVARGYELFNERDILIRDVSNYNSIGLGNPYKQPCANCHNLQHMGMDSSPGFMDLGTQNLPTADPLPDLPLFKLTCSPGFTPHPYLGRVVYTHDPGRALITGKCVDIGSINMQQLRSLAARAPYFSNGSAKTLRDVVIYYNRRFKMHYTEQNIQDLVNFLSVL